MSKRCRNRVTGGMIVWDKFDQIFYVAKGGNDANDGKNIETPVLTFSQAVTLATAETPTAINRFAIVCLDAGIYTENITLVSYVDIYAPNATLTGLVTAADYVSIKFKAQNVATGTTGVYCDGTLDVYIDIDTIVCAGTGIWVQILETTQPSTVDIKWKDLSLASGDGIKVFDGDVDVEGSNITMSGNAEGIDMRGGILTGSIGSIIGSAGTSKGVVNNGNGAEIHLFIGRLDTLGIGFSAQAAVSYISVNLIVDCTEAYYVDSDAELYITAQDIDNSPKTFIAGGVLKELETDVGYLSSGTSFALNTPTQSTDSPALSFLALNVATEVEGSIYLVTGADPHLRISVDDDGATPALTAVFDIYDDAILMSTDNTVDIGADGATRPKDYWGAGTVSAAGLIDTTRTQHAVSTYAAGGALTEVGPLTNGQLVIGSTGVAPVAAAITAGAGTTVTNGAGSITIAVTGGGFAWIDATSATYGITIQTGYVVNRGGGVTLTLPATAVLGDTVKITGKTGLWVIAQNANQSIGLGSATTTVGAGGSLTATDAGDCIEMVCITAGASTVWRVTSVVGNITVA